MKIVRSSGARKNFNFSSSGTILPAPTVTRSTDGPYAAVFSVFCIRLGLACMPACTWPWLSSATF